MSLQLIGEGTTPGLVIKTYPPSIIKTIQLSDYEISMEDFLIAAAYVLTNTDLEESDPRNQFVQYVKAMGTVTGHNNNATRLKSEQSPIKGIKLPFGL